jgi:hypothetical protein
VQDEDETTVLSLWIFDKEGRDKRAKEVGTNGQKRSGQIGKRGIIATQMILCLALGQWGKVCPLIIAGSHAFA